MSKSNNIQQDKKLFTEEDMKQFGLWLGLNFKNIQGKSIDKIFKSSPFNTPAK